MHKVYTLITHTLSKVACTRTPGCTSKSVSEYVRFRGRVMNATGYSSYSSTNALAPAEYIL